MATVFDAEGGKIVGLSKLEVGDRTNNSDGRVQVRGATRVVGFNGLSTRYELAWRAGQEGKPALNAVLAWPGTYAAAAAIATEIADKHFEVLGTNMTTALCTYYAEGGIVLTTAGADADQAILAPHLDTDQTPWTAVTWGTDKETEWEALIQVGGNIGDAIIWAGLKLTNTPTVATDADQAFFRYQNGVNSGKWEAVSSIGGVDSQSDSGVVAVATNDIVHFKIEIDDTRVARMYINGALVKTTTALTDAIDLIPYIGVQASGAAAAKAIRVMGQAISRVIG